MAHEPTRSSEPLIPKGTKVDMILDPASVRAGTNAHNMLYTNHLTYCIAIATFCTCGKNRPASLTHVPVATQGVGQMLVSSDLVHNNDTIVIGLGNDALAINYAAEFKRSKDLIKSGLPGGMVVTWAMDWAGRYPELDPHTFVVQGLTYGRAAAYVAPAAGAGKATVKTAGSSAPTADKTHATKAVPSGRTATAGGASGSTTVMRTANPGSCTTNTAAAKTVGKSTATSAGPAKTAVTKVTAGTTGAPKTGGSVGARR